MLQLYSILSRLMPEAKPPWGTPCYFLALALRQGTGNVRRVPTTSRATRKALQSTAVGKVWFTSDIDRILR